MWILVSAMALQAAAQPELPGWMAGCWEQREASGWTEECWTSARAGIMLGSSRSGTGERLELWEAMQIELTASQMGFWASPNGAKRTRFAWVPGPQAGVTFVNTDNDYPQQVRYWRDGPDLMAEISMADGSKRHSWRFKPLVSSPPTPRGSPAPAR